MNSHANYASLAFRASRHKRSTCFWALMEPHLRGCTVDLGLLCLEGGWEVSGVGGWGGVQIGSTCYLLFFSPSTHHSHPFLFSKWSVALLNSSDRDEPTSPRWEDWVTVFTTKKILKDQSKAAYQLKGSQVSLWMLLLELLHFVH